MKNKNILLLVLLIICSVAFVKPVKAQCAACSAMVETNAKSGSKKTRGLNKGVLLLVATPFIAVGILSFVWVTQFRRPEHEHNLEQEAI